MRGIALARFVPRASDRGMKQQSPLARARLATLAFWALTIALVPSCSPSEEPVVASPSSSGDPQPETVSLFNGTDLSGWHVDVPAADGGAAVEPTFAVEDGVLISRGQPQGHLITDASYGDYRLTVEYRWPGDPGNCGVLVHCSTPRRLYKMFPQSIECQMHVGNAGDFWCIGENIAVENMAERRPGDPAKWGVEEGQGRRILNLTDDSESPLGEWNEMVIECRGDEVQVWVNGDMVNHGTGCTAREGQIALQAEGARCEFRRVELERL